MSKKIDYLEKKFAKFVEDVLIKKISLQENAL